MSSRSVFVLGFCSMIILISGLPLLAQLTDQDRRYCAQQKTTADRQRCEQQILQQRAAEQQRQQQLQQQLAAQRAAAAQKAAAEKAAAERAAEQQRQQQLQQQLAAQRAAAAQKAAAEKAAAERAAEQQRQQQLKQQLAKKPPTPLKPAPELTPEQQQRRDQMLQQNQRQIAAQKAVLRPYTKDDAVGNLKLWLDLDFCHSNQAFSLRELQNADAGGSLSAGLLQTAIEAAAPWAVLNQINQQVKQYQNKSITEIEAQTSSIQQKLRTNDPIAAYRNSYCAN